MKICKNFLICLLLLTLLTGCSMENAVSDGMNANETEASTQDGGAGDSASSKKELEDMLDSMTLREKVGQLFVVRPDALDVTETQEQVNAADETGTTTLTPEMKEVMKDYPVGGIAMFGKNLESPEQITAFNQDLQQASEIPLLIAVDEEGGRVARLANHEGFDLPKYESAAAVGATGNYDDGFAMGNTIGAYLHDYGFNMDFAPVADVNTNPDNPVIGERAFSSDASVAALMAGAMADGLHAQGIIPVFKHFPGHGDTAEDSHQGIAVSYKTEEELRACEWFPFEEADGNDCIMVGHIALPNVCNNLTPATLSHEIVHDILKESLGFDGLVITDSLSMDAITKEYSPGDAAIGALQAGCDLLLMPNGLQEAFDAVVEAVEQGVISEQQLDETVLRILTFKQEQGLFDE